MTGSDHKQVFPAFALGAALLLGACQHSVTLVEERFHSVKTAPLATKHAPSPRALQTAVWNGEGMLIWGGMPAKYDRDSRVDGAIYYPGSKRWYAIPKVEATTRYNHTAVWNGTHMIVWGGMDFNSHQRIGTGWSYDPEKERWHAVNDDDAPTPRSGHTAIWTGRYMIIWGGEDDNNVLGDGGVYDPEANTWGKVNPHGAPEARAYHTAVWTGSRMLVWGGLGAKGELSSGAAFDPQTNTWEAINAPGAPSGRLSHTAVWTGSKMIVWGGRKNSDHYLQDGGVYDPNTKTWTPTMVDKTTPSPRELHSAVWTGHEMLIWGGHDSEQVFGGGGAYKPDADSWRKIIDKDANGARTSHSAVWTGTEMLIFGGRAADGAFVTEKTGVTLKQKALQN